MSTFTTQKNYETTASFIPYAIAHIREVFSSEHEGFDVNQKMASYNKAVLEVTKGNLVKKIVGLKQGLEIVLESDNEQVTVRVKGTVLKDQLIPTLLTLFVTWPVLIPQIVGLIKQSGLDEKAIGVIDTAYAYYKCLHPTYCTHCGGEITGNPEVCPHCGTRL